MDVQTQNLLDTHVLPFVERLPWHATHPVRFDASQGYEGRGVLGARSGPAEAIDFENVAHEMAHAIDILESGQMARLARPNWGLRIKGGFELAGRMIYEPNTMQASEREARVCGIQWRILEMVQHPACEGFAQRHARILTKWMPDWIFGGDNEEQRIATRARLIQEAYLNWPDARVAGAWQMVQPRLSVLTEPKIEVSARRTLRR